MTTKEIGAENTKAAKSRVKKRHLILRQDRIAVGESDQFQLFLQNKSYRIYNYSTSGIAILAKPGEQAPAGQQVGSLVYDGLEVGEYQLEYVRSQGDEAELCWAYKIIGASLDTSLLDEISKAQNFVIESHRKKEYQSSLPDELRLQVYEIKNMLTDLQAYLQTQFDSSSGTSLSKAVETEAYVAELIAEYLDRELSPIFSQFGKLTQKFSPEQHAHLVSFVRDQLGELILKSPFSNRVFNKPLGYAGDYETMNIIYRNEAVGESLYSKCLHKYFLNKPAAQAVRNRAEYLEDKIRDLISNSPKNNLRILSVASGPAQELQNLFSKIELDGRKLHCTLVDQEERALKFAMSRLAPIVGPMPTISMEYAQLPMRGILDGDLDGERYDFIYSAGLFDYFGDPLFSLASKKLFDLLESEGLLIIGNFNKNNPNSLEMSLSLDWNLIYRSREDLKRLLNDLDGEITIESEPNEINLFANARKSE